MEKIIFDGFGCQIVEREDKLFVKYDSGGFASYIKEKEITQSEADKIKLSEKDAHEILVKSSNKIIG